MPKHIHNYGKDSEMLQAIQYTRYLPVTIPQKLQWLAGRGFTMCESQYHKTLAFLRNNTVNRLNYIAYQEFADEYLMAIDRAKEDLAKVNRMMTHPEITPNQFIALDHLKIIREKWLMELYDADTLVAHTMEKIHEGQLSKIKSGEPIEMSQPTDGR